MKYLFLLLFSAFISAQNTKVIYQFETNFTEEMLKDEYTGFFYKNIQNAASNIELQLVYNDTLANFSLIEKNVADENYANAVSYIGATEKIFCVHNKFYQATGNGMAFKKNDFLVKNTINKDWTITKETLVVNGYKCYKAFQIIEEKYEGNIYKHAKTAWFCPEIPSNYGPEGSGGLPGLILFLEENGEVYKMKSIVFNNSTKIEIPLLQNVISVEERNKKIIEKHVNK